MTSSFFARARFVLLKLLFKIFFVELCAYGKLLPNLPLVQLRKSLLYFILLSYFPKVRQILSHPSTLAARDIWSTLFQCIVPIQ